MSKLETANTTIIRPARELDLGRRQMFRVAGVTTLSAAAVAILGGCKSTSATTMASEGDVNTLNVALGLEHEAINAYQLGAESGLLLKSQADVLMLAAKLEKGAANAYLGVIPAFESKDLAQVAGRLAADETMHWTVLASALKQALPEKALSFGA